MKDFPEEMQPDIHGLAGNTVQARLPLCRKRCDAREHGGRVFLALNWCRPVSCRSRKLDDLPPRDSVVSSGMGLHVRMPMGTEGWEDPER